MAKMDSLVANMRQFSEYTKQAEAAIAKMVREMGAASGAGGSGGGNNGAVPEGSVAASPSFSTSSAAATVLRGMGGVAMSLPAVASAALGSPAEIAAYQLSTSRAGFFSGQSYATTASQQMGMSQLGTATSKTDAIGAQAALQAGGVYNIGQVGGGVASLSNYAPQLGLTGTAAATATLNQGKSVNMFNMLGISARGANGMALDPNTLVNEFVQKIFDATPPLKNGSSTEAMAYLMGALQPGNQLYMMLQTYFQDDNMRNLVITKLFAKAKGLPANATKDQLSKAGITTKTTGLMSNYNAAQLGLTQATTNGILGGTDTALSQLTTATNDFAGAAKHLNGLLSAYGYGSTMLGGFNGAVALLASSIAGNILGPVLALLGGGKGGGGGLVGGLGKMTGIAGGVGATVAGGAAAYSAGKNGSGLSVGTTLATTLSDAVSGFLIGGPWGALAGAGVGLATSVGGYYAGKSMAGTTSGQASGGNSHGTTSYGGANLIAGGTPAGASSVINIAASVIGTPYAWGGGGVNGPTVGVNQGADVVGFDCSSLVQYVFAKQGINLPRTTYGQVKCGKAIMPRNAAPGDLLFFGNPLAPDHVAIYIGNGRIIQAPHSGGQVEIASVDLGSVAACRRVLSGAAGSMGLSTLFSSSTMSDLGLGNQALGGGGVSAVAGTGVGSGGGVLTSVGSHGLTAAASATNGMATTSSGGITINVTVPASSSPNAIAQTTKTVTAAVQQAMTQSNVRTN